MNEFQESLQDLMIENGLNNSKLAKDLDISEDTISGYFVSGFYPKIDIAIKLADYFDCSLDFLLGLTDIKNKEYKLANKNILDNFNRNFAKILKNSNISNAQAMKTLKMGEYTMYRWRKGTFPKTVNLISIAKYLEVSIDYLLGNDKDEWNLS
mgnify:CR=1 FL=1